MTSHTDQADQLPPCDLEIERAVLGSMLLSQSCFDDVAKHVAADDFYDHRNQAIYRHLAEMHLAGGKVDFAILRASLRETGEWESRARITGINAAYLAELMQAVPVFQNAAYYAKIVRKKAVLRSLRRAGEDIVHASFDTQADTGNVLDQCQRLLDQARGRTVQEVPADSTLATRETEYLDMLESGESELFTLAFLQHQPYKSGGVFLDVSPCISRGGRVLASETWCHATSIWSLTIR